MSASTGAYYVAEGPTSTFFMTSIALCRRLLALHCEATERVDLMRECPALTLLFNQLTNRTAFPLLLKELQKDLPHATKRVHDAEDECRNTMHRRRDLP